MSSYIKKTLGVNEHITGTAKLHWILFVGPFGVIIFGLFVVFFSSFILIKIPLLIKVLPLLVGIGFWGIIWLICHTTEYISTNKRVLIKKGIISRHVSEIYLNKIEGALVTQSIIGRFLNYGTLQVRGIGGTIEEYPFINNPFIFHKTIDWK